MAMKSVPPVVAFHLRQSAIAKPNTMPPKMLVTNGSVARRAKSPSDINEVSASAGRTSVRMPVIKMTYRDHNVKRRPIKRKPIQTGTAFSARFIGENGTTHPLSRGSDPSVYALLYIEGQTLLYMLYCICCACVHARTSFPLRKSL